MKRKKEEILPDLAAGMFIAAVMCVCISLFITTMADHACGPVAHAAPSEDVVLGGPLMLATTPHETWQTAARQTGHCLTLLACGVFTSGRFPKV